MGLILCQTPTNIGDDGISPIIMSLVEDSHQARPMSVGMQFKRLHKTGIGKNGCFGAQMLQAIKQPLAHVITGEYHLLLACVFAIYQLMQGSGYLCELGDEPVIVSCEPKKTSELGDGGGVGHFLISSILPSSAAIALAETICPI